MFPFCNFHARVNIFILLYIYIYIELRKIFTYVWKYTRSQHIGLPCGQPIAKLHFTKFWAFGLFAARCAELGWRMQTKVKQVRICNETKETWRKVSKKVSKHNGLKGFRLGGVEEVNKMYISPDANLWQMHTFGLKDPPNYKCFLFTYLFGRWMFY